MSYYEIDSFKKEMEKIDENFVNQLLDTITDEYENVLKQLEDKEKEISNLSKIIKAIENSKFKYQVNG